MTKNRTPIRLALLAASALSIPAASHAVDANLDDVESLGGDQWRVPVPGLGNLIIEYASSSDPRNAYNGSLSFGTPVFTVAAGGSFTVSVEDDTFSLAGFQGEVWDLDTIRSGTETVTFNGGYQMTGVPVNILNSEASQPENVVYTQVVPPDGSGQIAVVAGPVGGAFGFGKISVTASDAESCVEGGDIVWIKDETGLTSALEGNIVCGESLINSDRFQELHASNGRIEEQGNNAGDLGSWSIVADPAFEDASVVSYTYDGGNTYEYRLFQDTAAGSNPYVFCETGTGAGQTDGRANTQAEIISSGNCPF